MTGDATAAAAWFAGVVFQVMLIDMVFSLDSVITAVGMVKLVPGSEWVGLTIMITAVLVAVGEMRAFAGAVSRFGERHPTIQMPALSFLILIGLTLTAEGFHLHIPRGSIYFAMAYSPAVELVNLRVRKRSSPVTLHQMYVPVSPGAPPDAYGEAADGGGCKGKPASVNSCKTQRQECIYHIAAIIKPNLPDTDCSARHNLNRILDQGEVL